MLYNNQFKFCKPTTKGELNLNTKMEDYTST